MDGQAPTAPAPENSPGSGQHGEPPPADVKAGEAGTNTEPGKNVPLPDPPVHASLPPVALPVIAAAAAAAAPPIIAAAAAPPVITAAAALSVIAAAVKSGAAAAATTAAVAAESEVDLVTLTMEVRRDVMGRARQQIKAEAAEAKTLIDKYSYAVVVEYQTRISAIRKRQLAEAPLFYVDSVNGKCPCLAIAPSFDLCVKNDANKGLFLRNHIRLAKDILLDSVREHFGQDTDVIVNEVSYGDFQMLYTWPGYCYIQVILINTAVVYSRTVNEIMESKKVKDPNKITLSTGNNKLVDVPI